MRAHKNGIENLSGNDLLMKTFIHRFNEILFSFHLQGHSGAPITRNSKLIAIFNHGLSCDLGIPDIATEIAYHHFWITSTIEIRRDDRGLF